MSVYLKEKPEYLKQSIESMIKQTIAPDEIIIVKDGPLTDELDKTIDEYVNSYKELFTIIPLEKNSGLGNALNVGLQKSKNELVARMDSDDISYLDRCEKLLKRFELDSDLSVVGGQINEFVDSTDNVVSSRVVPTDYKSILRYARRRSPFNHPTVVYKKSIILEDGGYPSSGRKEDLDLFLHLLSKGYRVENISDVVLYYRADPNNIARRKNWKNCKEYISIIKKYWKLGFCRFSDYLVVSLGQIIIFLLPSFLFKRFNQKFLRKKPKQAK